jgi:surface antigen
LLISIHRIIDLLKIFFSSLGLGFRKTVGYVYQNQKNLSEFIKRHRTVKILHLVRGYSALGVVISCAILVAASNVASGKGSSSLLFGYWAENEAEAPDLSKNMKSEASLKENLAFLPLSKPKTTIDPQAKDELESQMFQPAQKEYLAAGGASPLRDPEEEGGVKIYTVEEGDTVSGIAAQYHITTNTILWANDIDNVNQIKPGDKIFILPTSGVSHTVKAGETLDAIAKKYKADKDKIIAFNDLPADGSVTEGEEIVIPGGEKELPQSTTSSTSTLRRQYATPQGGTPAVSGWKKLEGKAGAGHRFPYGYCTWYVAQRRYVPWGGNAGTWLYHAKAAGYLTGKTPRVGAILVTAESWWGHVAIVESVGGGSITISEMNYAHWGKTDRRTLSTSSRVIKGYIY